MENGQDDVRVEAVILNEGFVGSASPVEVLAAE
jgi:hypothetical protein